MTAILIIIGALILAYVGWLAVTVVRGNNYQALVRQTVIAELGAAATP
jgi:hypothetical protein